MIFGAANLRAFCSTGVPVTFGGVSAYPDGVPILGLLDRSSANLLGQQGFGGVEVDRLELRLPFNTFAPMPVSGDTVTADGGTYTVDAPTSEDDGAFLCYGLTLSSIPAQPGTASIPGDTMVDLQAVPNISQYMVVAAAGGGGGQIADSNNLMFFGEVIGIATAAALAGSAVTVQFSGPLSNPAWSWVAGQPIFLGSNGQLTQLAPVTGFLQTMGVPLSPTSMLVEVQEPIQL